MGWEPCIISKLGRVKGWQPGTLQKSTYHSDHGSPDIAHPHQEVDWYPLMNSCFQAKLKPSVLDWDWQHQTWRMKFASHSSSNLKIQVGTHYYSQISYTNFRRFTQKQTYFSVYSDFAYLQDIVTTRCIHSVDQQEAPLLARVQHVHLFTQRPRFHSQQGLKFSLSSILWR